MTQQRSRSSYTLEFKQEGVRQVLAGQSIGAVADALGIPRASLGNWVREHGRGQLGAGAPAQKSAPTVVTPEQMEIARLRAENERLRMERDIAKKAAAYFAQDTLQGTPGFKK